jgi:indolepyruvate ferredoxin oxidoreductase beta subunit
MVMLGALVGCNATPLKEEWIKGAIENTTKRAFLDSNIQAFEFGLAAASVG